jgi:hypothetical protein
VMFIVLLSTVATFKHLKESCITVIIVGFEVLTAVSMKTAVFWVVAPCSLVEGKLLKIQ